ncbi:hypothetical protein EDC96DRAFT_136580 [Choanephora cucurbitarum]|nr:hypothetical protein EDC96DRAFT_136580 [Choanephora cucurbitarum]
MMLESDHIIKPNVPIAEEVEEPSGDELDDISARDIAMARYKRNHDYLSEIFTPYHADAIVPPSLDISFTKEELDKQMEEYTEKTKRHQTQYQHQLSSLQQEQTQFWEMMNQLNEATTLETIESTANALAKQMDLQIEHSANPVKVISIPGLQEEKPSFVQEMDTSMDMYFSDQRDQEESNDSFFNEMVNTEDMGN